MYTAVDIAKYFASLNEELKEYQIQRLVYHSYCWYIYEFNYNKYEIEHKLFNEQPIVTKKGPIFLSIQKEFKRLKKFSKSKNYLIDDDYQCKLDNKTRSLLIRNYKIYALDDENKLSNMSYVDEICRNTKKKRKVSDLEIFEYCDSI